MTGLGFDFVSRFLVDIGILVCAEKDFFATCNVCMTFFARFVDSLLYIAVRNFSKETAFFNNVKEKFPSFVCNRQGEGFYIVATTGGIDNFV